MLLTSICDVTNSSNADIVSGDTIKIRIPKVLNLDSIDGGRLLGYDAH
jgi:hypothetical protein